MHRDFEITNGIRLSQPPYEVDLHNDFDFQELHYSIKERTVSLHWRRSAGDWVRTATPAAVRIEFIGVSEFRFLRRDPKLPFTEDDCVRSIGFWTDEAWARGVMIMGATQTPDPSWRTAVDFMSGAVVIIQAESAHAHIEG